MIFIDRKFTLVARSLENQLIKASIQKSTSLTNAFSSKRSLANEWFACRFDRFRRNPRGPHAHTPPFAAVERRTGRGTSSWSGGSAQRNPCGPDSGPCFDRCRNKGQSSAITWTARRLDTLARVSIPVERLHCVIVFRVFRDDFCVLSVGLQNAFALLTERSFFFLPFLDGFSSSWRCVCFSWWDHHDDHLFSAVDKFAVFEDFACCAGKVFSIFV